jgi:oligopeptide/dipeptide ABC transporter ATP-binding protein
MSAALSLLQANDLHKTFTSASGDRVHAVDGVDVSVSAGEVVGIVGESGSGKSTLGRCVIGLEPLTRGDVLFRNIPLGQLKGTQQRQARKALQIVFQNPATSLNPLMTVQKTIEEPLQLWTRDSSSARRARVRSLLADVELPGDVAERKPRQLSGGQQQRVALARALACDPEIILLDEPTSALDAATEVAIFELLGKLKSEHGLSYILISHDIVRVSTFADRILVMYAGQVVEQGTTRQVTESPTHPYTRSLLDASELSLPEELRVELLDEAEHALSGCRLRNRCPLAREGCELEQDLTRTVAGSRARCHVTAPGGNER